MLPFAPPGKATVADWLMPPLLLLRAFLLHDARPLLRSLLAAGLAASAALALLAGLSSWREAGMVAPRAIAADAWVSARASACFDSPVPLAGADLARLGAALPGAALRRVVVGPARLGGPARPQAILVGVDGPRTAGLIADRSSLARLGLRRPGTAVRVGARETRVASATSGLATPPGPPLLLTSFSEAHELLHLPPGTVHHVALDFPAGPPADLASRLARLEADLPHLAARPQAAMLAATLRCGPRGTFLSLGAGLAMLLLGGALVAGGLAWSTRHADALAVFARHGASDGQARLLGLGLVAVPVAGALLLALLIAPLLLAPLPWAALSPADARAALAIALMAMPLALGIAARRQAAMAEVRP